MRFVFREPPPRFFFVRASATRIADVRVGTKRYHHVFVGFFFKEFFFFFTSQKFVNGLFRVVDFEQTPGETSGREKRKKERRLLLLLFIVVRRHAVLLVFPEVRAGDASE